MTSSTYCITEPMPEQQCVNNCSLQASTKHRLATPIILDADRPSQAGRIFIYISVEWAEKLHINSFGSEKPKLSHKIIMYKKNIYTILTDNASSRKNVCRFLTLWYIVFPINSSVKIYLLVDTIAVLILTDMVISIIFEQCH